MKRGQDFLDGKISPNSSNENPIVFLEQASEIKAERVEWEWINYLPRKKLVLLAGLAGTGKTTLCLSIASIVSKGGHFPDGTRAARGKVVIWTGEDGIEDTLIPRLMAMKADMSNIYFVKKVASTDKDKNG